MRWPNNEHSDVATANMSGSCPLAQGDRTIVPSVRARISAERKRNEAAEAKEGGEAVPVIELVQRREANPRPLASQAGGESGSASAEESKDGTKGLDWFMCLREIPKSELDLPPTWK